MAFRLKNSLQTNADVQDHAQPNTSSECLVHFFREKNGMPHKTDQKVNKKTEQIKTLQNIKFINHDIRRKFLLAKLLLQASILIKMGAISTPEILSPGRLHSTGANIEHTPAPKIRLHLQQSIISAEINHNSEPLFFKTEKEKRTKKEHHTAPATRSK